MALAVAIGPPATAQTIDTSVDGGGTRLVTPAVPPLGALQSFDFEFGNGGHKLKAISLLGAGARTQVAFNDNDGNDPYRVRATYRSSFRFTPTASQTIDGRGRGVLTRTLSARPGFIPVLRGFSLAFADGGDHEVTELVVALQPIGDQNGQHRLRVGLREHQDNRPFDYAVQVVWMPLGNIADAHTTISDRGKGNTAPNRPRGLRGDAVLKGFSFRYVHDDLSDDSHYVQRVAVDLGAPECNRAAVSFHDGDGDDRRMVTASYATLR